MQTVQLISVTAEQLQEQQQRQQNAIIDAVKSQFKLYLSLKQPPLYLSRLEVSKMLNVSLVTLNKWNKNGTLKALGIGGRVLYRQTDIESKIVDYKNG
jgi:hypothetical protein